MDERLEKISQSTNRSRKAKNGEKKVPQRGLGVAQLEKLRMEEQQKRQQQQGGIVVIPHSNLQRQVKAFHTPPPPPPFAVDLRPPRDSIMCLAAAAAKGLNVDVPIQRNNNGSALVESNSCVIHVCVAPDSMVVAAAAPFQQGLGAEIYGSVAVNHQELRLFEPSLWPPGPPTELPMVNVSSCGTVQTEPPSNQIYSANCANWPVEDKIPGRKRLWPFSEEIPVQSKSTRSELLDVDPNGMFSRNSVATCFEPIQMNPPWQSKSAMVSPAGKYPSALNISCDSGQRQAQKIPCLGQAIVKDSCSSTSSMQPGFQLNWKGSCESDVSSQEKEVPCEFLTLELFTSVNDNLHSKSKEHSATSNGKHSTTSNACEDCELPNHLQQVRNTERGSPTMYQFGGLFKQSSSSVIDDRCSIPFYKFLCYESNSKRKRESVYRDKTNKPADLDLRLSL